MVIVTLALVVAVDNSRHSNLKDRVDRLLGIELPATASNVVEPGSARSILLRALDLDRSRSLAFVLAENEVDAFLSQYCLPEPLQFPSAAGPAINDGLSRNDISWLHSAELTVAYRIDTKVPAGADWMAIYLYRVGATDVGIWIHGDWN